MESLLRESMDEAQIPRGEQRTRAGSASASRAPLIAVVGLGGRGLPTALALRQAGADVLGLDTSERRLAAIRVHRCDLSPADHERLVIALGGSRFEVDADLARLSEADAIVICVPAADTAAGAEPGPLAAACEAVCRFARRGQTIVLTSTSHVGATRELLIDPLTEAEFDIGRDICVAFSPERDGPTAAASSRIVGAGGGLCVEKARAVLGPIAPALEVVASVEAAEMAKLYEDAFHVVNSSLVDRLAGEAAAHGLSTAEVIGAASGSDGLMRFAPGTD
ncbi:MAG TPA: 2-dehydropantoate 2-reductase N-terminal domain-containing protein [Solirubrobacterales bacterium]|nr:2-dehydropantoate 2-reductase N-terminal domain-containing protein [Solirubrobacterales bacterium]